MTVKLLGTFEYFDKLGAMRSERLHVPEKWGTVLSDQLMFEKWVNLETKGFTNVSFTPVE